MSDSKDRVRAAKHLLEDGDAKGALDTLGVLADGEATAAMLAGVAAERLEDRAAAIRYFSRAAALDPTRVEAPLNLGICLRAMGQDEMAAAAFDQALEIDPGHAAARFARANLHLASGDWAEAADTFEMILAAEPDHLGAANNLGLARRQLGQIKAAIAAFESVLARDSGNVDAEVNLGALRAEEGNFDTAIEHYRRVLEIAPEHGEAANNLGVALLDKGRAGEAVTVLEAAVAGGAAGPETRANLGNALAKMGDVEGATAAYDAALALRPDAGIRVRKAMLLPVVVDSAGDYDAARRDFEAGLDNLLASPPELSDPYVEVGATTFNLSYHDASNRDLMKKIAVFYCAACPALLETAPHCLPNAERANGKVRIGFVSRYLRTHSIGRCFEGVIRKPGRDDVGITVFTFDPRPDPLWDRIAADVDRTVLLPSRLAEARRLIAAEALDVLIYTDIGMEPLTYFLSFARLAPVQCVTWGHPESPETPGLDYFLSGEAMEGEEAPAHYGERLVQLPGPPLLYDRPAVPETLKPRAAFDLPDSGALYFCAQTLIKVHPEMDSLFSEILTRDRTGTLVFLEGYVPELAARLRDRFAATMPKLIDRIRFLPALSHMDYMNVLALADVSLDTRPFGGGNTSWQAIACGTPVVTWPSPYLRGRFALALYQLMGLHDLIATDGAEFVDLAVRYGIDPDFRDATNRRVAAGESLIFADRVSVDAFYDFVVKAARS